MWCKSVQYLYIPKDMCRLLVQERLAVASGTNSKHTITQRGCLLFPAIIRPPNYSYNDFKS
jgi:hypothetical protein